MIANLLSVVLTLAVPAGEFNVANSKYLITSLFRMYVHVQFVRLVFDPLVFTCISADTSSIGGCPQPNQPKLDPCCELH